MLFNVETTITKDVSISTVSGVDVLVEYDDGTMLVRPSPVGISTGSTRKNSEDVFNKAVAYELSVGRALKQFSKQFLRRGDGLVKHIDDMQKLKSEQTAMQQELSEDEYRHTQVLRDLYTKILSSDTVGGFLESLRSLDLNSNIFQSADKSE